MNVVVLIFDQEGVSAKAYLNVKNGKEAEQDILDRAYNSTWKEEMEREEFDNEIANQWDFENHEFENAFEFNGYELYLDHSTNSVYSRQ